MSAASLGIADVREDEEQFQKLQDCIDLLLACGYFRARIKGLAPFDKIVGGIVWCISVCNYSVDVDLLYADNATIGQKIALTEKVVLVLKLLKCPHSIEPHQIQGLDFIHIFPVIQWLVKRTLEAKQEHGDELEAYAMYQYQKSIKGPQSIGSDYTSLLAKAYPERYFKRGAATITKDILDDAMCTLAEYLGSKRAIIQNDDEVSYESLEESSSRDKVSTKVMRKVIDSIITSDEKSLSEEEILDRQIAQISLENETLKKDLEIGKGKQEELEKIVANLRVEKSEMDNIIANSDPEVVNEFKDLIEEHDSFIQRSKEFENDCAHEVAKLDEEIKRIQQSKSGTESERITQFRALLNIKEKELASQRILYSEISKQFTEVQQELDDIPSQIEIAQYQQRFLELYNQMASKHRQTKEYYIVYNTLLDVKNYTKKELELLAKIEDVLDQATKEQFRDSFIQHLQGILKGVESNYDKIVASSVNSEAKKSELSEEYSQLKEDQRAFIRATEEFKKLCKRNEELREMVKKKQNKN